MTVSVSVGGQNVRSVVVPNSAFNTYVGAANAGMVYVDVTGSRNWQWADFDNHVQVMIDQSSFASNHFVYYDAVGLRVTTAVGADNSGSTTLTSDPNTLVDP